MRGRTFFATTLVRFAVLLAATPRVVNAPARAEAEAMASVGCGCCDACAKQVCKPPPRRTRRNAQPSSRAAAWPSAASCTQGSRASPRPAPCPRASATTQRARAALRVAPARPPARRRYAAGRGRTATSANPFPIITHTQYATFKLQVFSYCARRSSFPAKPQPEREKKPDRRMRRWTPRSWRSRPTGAAASTRNHTGCCAPSLKGSMQ